MMKTLTFDSSGTVCGAGSYEHDVELGTNEHECSNEQYEHPEMWKLVNGEIVAAPPRPAPVPYEISRAQAKIQLRRAGLRERVEMLISEAGEEAQDWYAEAGTWQRDHPYITQIGALLPLTAEEMDEQFTLASKILA